MSGEKMVGSSHEEVAVIVQLRPPMERVWKRHVHGGNSS
jgi:hypothetical protein